MADTLVDVDGRVRHSPTGRHGRVHSFHGAKALVMWEANANPSLVPVAELVPA